MRILATVILAVLLGLLVARVPSMGESERSFSWFGFVGGVAIVSLAAGIARILAPGAAAAGRVLDPLQRSLIHVSISALLLAVVSFVLLLYTSWQWPRYLAAVVIPVGALSTLLGAGTVLFGAKKHGA